MNCKIAVECQCSSISIGEYSDRNETYLENGYCPLWIFGGGHSDYILNGGELHRRAHLLEKDPGNGAEVVLSFDGIPRYWRTYSKFRLQRLRRLHGKILEESRLFIASNDSFYQVTDFRNRYYAKTLGWYHSQPVLFDYLIKTHSCAHGKSIVKLESWAAKPSEQVVVPPNENTILYEQTKEHCETEGMMLSDFLIS